MSKILDRMLELKSGKNASCSQILMSIVGLEPQGKDDPDLFRAMGALGYGLYSQHTCGALTGGVCALAMYAKDKEQVKAYSKTLCEWFEDEFGGVQCRDILGEGNPPSPKCNEVVQATIEKCFDMLGMPVPE